MGPGSVPQSPVCWLGPVCLSEDADTVVGNIQAGEKEASVLASYVCVFFLMLNNTALDGWT